MSGMAVRDELKELARQGFTAVQLAERLSVSRARVYQIAAEENLQLAVAARTSAPRIPAPRVITGGVSVPLTAMVAGTISELLVAADLMARGWLVYRSMTRDRGVDILAVRDETIKKIEVRSARRNDKGTIVYPVNDLKNAMDHLALVVTGEPVTYRPDLV